MTIGLDHLPVNPRSGADAEGAADVGTRTLYGPTPEVGGPRTDTLGRPLRVGPLRARKAPVNGSGQFTVNP